MTTEHKQENLAPKVSYAHLSDTSSPFEHHHSQNAQSNHESETENGVVEIDADRTPSSSNTAQGDSLSTAQANEEPEELNTAAEEVGVIEIPELSKELVRGPIRLRKASNAWVRSSGGIKLPKRLVWTKIKTARLYGVQISRDTDFSDSHTYYTKRNYYPFELFPNQKYHWRVRAYDTKKNPISEYSSVYSFKLHKREPAEKKKIQEEEIAADDVLEIEL